MTSDPVTFVWAEVEGFRGFRDRQRIELDSSVVILSGPNGTGKTSFFDALQWLLLGSLKRLEPWRPRRNTEHIASAFRPGEPAIVSAVVIFGGTEVELRRQGRHDSGVLEWTDLAGTIRGEEAESRLVDVLSPRSEGKQALRRLLMTSALLQQDVVREVLEDKAADRYEQLASLLGLDAVAEFEAATRRRADRLEESGKSARSELAMLQQQHRSLAQQVETVRTQLAAAPDTARIREQLIEQIAAEAPTVRLVVLPTEVVNAAERRSVSERAVWSTPVVVADEA
jgi:chromosome segregation protein